MNRRTGKIHPLGKSFAVTLPKDWVRGNDLGAGDEVEIWYDGEIRVRKKQTGEDADG